MAKSKREPGSILNSPLGLDFEPEPKDIQRFLAKVQKDQDFGCWNWTGAKDDKGYGQFRFKVRSYWAHRWSYAVFRRPLLEALTVEHKCQNPSCVNPWHLELISNSENTANGNRNRKAEVPF